MLFGVRLRSIFTSRWFALLWAILVMLTAIQFVGPGDDSQSGQGADQAATGGPAVEQGDRLSNAL